MDVALAVEVLLLNPERALRAAVFVHPVPEGAVMGLKLIAGPGPPAGELAPGLDVQIRSVIECVFGKLVHEKWPSCGAFHPLDGPGKREQRARAQRAAQEDQRAAGAGHFAVAFDQFALVRGVEEFAGERHRHARALQHRRGDREQAVVGKGHEAAAMDVALAVEVLFLDPERAAHAAVLVHPVPERPVVGLKTVAGPGPPAGEFALGFDVQVGAAEECVLGSSFTKNGLQLECFGP